MRVPDHARDLRIAPSPVPRVRSPDAPLVATDLDIEFLGEGPTVVLVHGSIVDGRRTWRHQSELAEAWTLCIPNRPGFGASPPLARGDFELEAPLIAELLGDGAHLVGHSYGAVIALLAAALRPRAVRSLVVSEPGALQIAGDDPVVAAMIEQGEQLYRIGSELGPAAFLRHFRAGVHSSHETPDELPDWLEHGARLAINERPPWDGLVPLHTLHAATFPKLVISGGHSPAFETVCDTLAEEIGAERAVLPGRGHTIPSLGNDYNALLGAFLTRAQTPNRRTFDEYAGHRAMDDSDEVERFYDRCSDLMRELLDGLAAVPDTPRPFPEIEDRIGWPRRRIASVLGGVFRLRQREFGGRRPDHVQDTRQSASGRWEMWMDALQADAVRSARRS
jgi:pimeloyl-ACP methyl ester carboxylesterase